MADAHPVNEEIKRLMRDLHALEAEISAASQRSRSVFRDDISPYESPPKLNPFDSMPAQQQQPRKLNPFDSTATQRHIGNATLPRPQPAKRKEVEPRRYNGKEPVHEYLLQFELTARRNGWDDAEMATSLLCALEGPARSLLSELDDPCRTDYGVIRELLARRFGPVQYTEVHEQALQELRLARGQPIREMTPEVLHLCKLAYPEFGHNARNGLAVKALINTINDRDAIFYIKDKNPTSLDDVCTMYEKYWILTDSNHPKPAVKGVKSSDDDRRRKNCWSRFFNNRKPLLNLYSSSQNP